MMDWFHDFMEGLPDWAPVFLLVPIGVIVGFGLMAAWCDHSTDRRSRRAEIVERDARLAAGVPSPHDVETLIYERWGVGPILHGPTWTEENGLLPYTEGRVVRLAVRKAATYGGGLGTHSPAVIARWVLEEHDPMLLVRAVRANLPDMTLVAYMGGDLDRATLETVTALRSPA